MTDVAPTKEMEQEYATVKKRYMANFPGENMDDFALTLYFAWQGQRKERMHANRMTWICAAAALAMVVVVWVKL